MPCDYVLIRLSGNSKDIAEFLKKRLWIDADVNIMQHDKEVQRRYKDAMIIMRLMVSPRQMKFEDAIDALTEDERW